MIEYHEGPDKYLSLKMKKMRKKENINNSNEKDLFYLEHLMVLSTMQLGTIR